MQCIFYFGDKELDRWPFPTIFFYCSGYPTLVLWPGCVMVHMVHEWDNRCQANLQHSVASPYAAVPFIPPSMLFA